MSLVRFSSFLLITTVLFTPVAKAGMLDEDPLVASLHARFTEAHTPTFAQLIRWKGAPPADLRYSQPGNWQRCYERNLQRGQFESEFKDIRFTNYFSNQTVQMNASSEIPQEVFYNNAELQAILNIKLPSDADPKVKIPTLGYTTIRVDAKGFLLIEYATAFVSGVAELNTFELESQVTPTDARVISYTICDPAKLLY